MNHFCVELYSSLKTFPKIAQYVNINISVRYAGFFIPLGCFGTFISMESKI
jgi:hypothetical protein